ncbi:LLM class flavin-dependent oxidoreductase [uncultured Friedmanniella sp.]|uniref:LLM class flavin-dependent oxidoreductase n=1 Tax=uncultured Friedmanniella sp. TaxID=335381 RepID=UPI0035C94420
MTIDLGPTLGLAYVPTLPPERLRELARAVEASGLDELWVWEDCFKQSGIASAAAALAWTERITVGIGLLPVPLRNVALTAMELANLERMFPGRLIAGVGHGVQPWMEQTGARVASPLTLLREHTLALRALLAGERVTTEGRYVRLADVALDWPPTAPPPLMLGGAGPKALALAAELGDGVLLGACISESAVAEIAQRIDPLRGRAGRALVHSHLVAAGVGAQERLEREVPRWGATYASGIGVAGDAQTVAASVDRLVAAGATSVCFQPTEDEPDLLDLVRFLGEEVKPLVSLAGAR